MTIIVAIEHEDGVVIACDSQVSDGGTHLALHESQKKIGVNGPYIIGAAGRLRTGQVLMHASDLPVPDGVLTDDELNRFMINKFAAAAQEAMSSAGVETTMDSERLLTESELIVCVQGRAFSVGEDYSVMRASSGIEPCKGVAITGSGWRYALGAYHAIMNTGPAQNPAELAAILVESAIFWDDGCGGDIFAMHQERP